MGKQLVFKDLLVGEGITHAWALEPDQAAQSCTQEALGGDQLTLVGAPPSGPPSPGEDWCMASVFWTNMVLDF